MNLFVLHRDPVKAARYNCDKHVCKIILEAADMLCLAHWAYCFPRLQHAPKVLHVATVKITGDKHRTIWPYRPMSHNNNHVSKWVRESIANYQWTARHAIALCDEYTNRYQKVHASEHIIRWFSDNLPPIVRKSRSPFRQAVPDDCYDRDPVKAYRLCYVRYKSRFAKWRLGNIPLWYRRMMEDINAA